MREREYDADGNVSVVKVNGDIVSTYTYDANGNLTQRTDAMGQPYTFDYNTDGQMIRQEDPTGAFVEYAYDADGRLWKTRDGNGNEIVREYAVVGSSGSCPSCSGVGSVPIERLQNIIYPTFTKEFLYDDEGRVSEEIYHLSETESYSVTFTYDAFGRLESTTGPDNETTTYGYDLLGRRTSVTDSSGTTQFEYDLWDNLVALTDAENQRTEFEYYADGKLKLERRPMGEETGYEYDNFGRFWKVTDAKNQTTEYSYDAQSRIETIAYADGKTVTLSYDADGNLSGYSDGTTSATYTYDDIGRKLSEMVNYGPFSKSFSYTYYGNGLKHTFTAPDSTVYTYLYGLNNELQDVQIPSVGSMTIPNYTWNRPATVNYPGGTQKTYGYDALMRLQSFTVLDPTSTPLLDYTYTYDEVGNILTKTTEHGNYTYGYDAMSRVLTADNPVLADESYTYDDVGNRLTSADVSGSWTYNLNNELLGYADVEYDYDDNGNLPEIRVAGSVVWTYTYDAANRLVHVEDGTGSISVDYYYDPFGRRLWKDVGGTKTYFFYSEEGLIAEYDATGTEIRSYGYKPDSTWTTDPLWQKEGGAYYWYQNDHLGTPQKLTAQDGTVVWSAQYTAFGKADVQVETVTNNLRFPGQYVDVETGLLYNFHRYYDPKIGRYLRVDPIGFEGSDVNWYRYAQENPIRMTDPFGLTDYAEIEKGNLVYSCKCGWIDWTHASPGILNQMWNNSWGLAEFQKSIFAPLEQFSIGPHGELLLHKFGILANSPTFTSDKQHIILKVDLSMTQELKIKNVGLPYTIVGPYSFEYELFPECLDIWFLQDSAPNLAFTDLPDWQPPIDMLKAAYQRQASIALGLYMHLQEHFERNFQGGHKEHWWQPDPPYNWVPGVGPSSFSEEDLASDWIAFYMKVYKYSKNDIMDICDAVDTEEESQYIYRQLYGKDGLFMKKRPGTSHSWKPVNHNSVAPSCHDCNSGESYLEWPDKLNTIQPAYKDCWQAVEETKKWPRLRKD